MRRTRLLPVVGLAVLGMLAHAPASAGTVGPERSQAATAAAVQVIDPMDSTATYRTRLMNRATRQCLRAFAGTTRAGTGACTNTSYGWWEVTAVAWNSWVTYYRLKNQYTGKCLETRADDGVYAHIGTCGASNRQWWDLENIRIDNYYKGSLNRPSMLRGYASGTVILDFNSTINNMQWFNY